MSGNEPGDEEKVVALPGTLTEEPATPPSPPGRLHGVFIGGMAASALVGIIAVFGFITVGWPEDAGRVIIAVFFGALIVFLGCASAAVFTAARDTYPRRRGQHLD